MSTQRAERITRWSRRPGPRLALAYSWLSTIVVLSTIGACMSLERMAPPVEGTVAEVGRSIGHPARSLGRGRRIYVTKCAKCHGVEPIDRYSVEQWEQILPEMATEASLDVDELANLRAYILSAYGSMVPVHPVREVKPPAGKESAGSPPDPP